MEFGGRYLFSAPRTAVWAALNDADTLKAAIPGCRRLDWTGPSELECEIQVNFGLVNPVFTGDLELRDVRPAERYTLAGRGRGGRGGNGRGGGGRRAEIHAVRRAVPGSGAQGANAAG